MIENIALSNLRPPKSNLPILNTAEDIIREMIHQRDTGGYIAILAWRLTETVPDVTTARRVMDAVYNNKSLKECLSLLQTQTEVTRTQSNNSKETSLH